MAPYWFEIVAEMEGKYVFLGCFYVAIGSWPSELR